MWWPEHGMESGLIIEVQGIKSVHLASRRGRDNIYLSPSKTYSAKVKAF